MQTVTRTAEWPATQQIGEEKSKLFFMLAIGLNPKPGKIQNLPRIVMTKLSPAEESKAREKTRDRLFELFEKRRLEAAELRLRTEQFLNTAPSRPPPSVDNVEIVNLVSDDEDEDGQNDESKAAATAPPPPSVRTTRQRVLVNGSSASQQPQVITTQGGQVQDPRSLMPLLSKKEDKILFQKWRPESFSKLVDGKNAKECGMPPLNGVHKQLMAAPIKKSTPASSPLTVRNQASSPIWSTRVRITGGVYKTGNSNDVRNDGASSTLAPENLIIIDLD